MVDFDLGELSSPIEALRSDVEAAYKRLDTRWNEISDTLKKLPIPCDISYTFSQDPDCYPDYESLEWRKWKGHKRICIVSYSEEQTPFGYDLVGKVTPYEEWGAEQRIKMLQYVPQLFGAATRQTKEFIESTKN